MSLPENTNTEDGGATANTSALMIQATRITKFPAFYKADPAFWFEQVEATFHTHGITQDETKFKYVIQYAEPEILPHIVPIARKPPATDKYKAVKDRILQTFAETEETRLRRIFQGQNIDGKKPSHYVQDLKNAARDQVSDAVLRTLLLEQLPDQIRCVLGISTETDIDKLAKMADRMFELLQPPSVAAVQQQAPVRQENSPEDPLAQIISRLDRLESRLSERSRSNYRAGRGRSKSRGKSNSRDDPFCYYHRHFGKRARNCRSPCQWKNSDEKSEN